MSQTRGLWSIGLKLIASYRKLHLVVFVATVFDCDGKTSREFNGLFFKPGSHVPPTYLRFSRRLQLTMFGDLFTGSPAHLRCIAGVLKLARNANRIGAIFNSFISNMDRIVLLECQFSLALVLVMRYVRRKKKLEKMRTQRKYCAANASRANKSRPVSYFVRRVATPRTGIFLQVSWISSLWF